MSIPVTLFIQGMSCAACSGRVDRKLNSIDGVEDVNVNLASHTARFTLTRHSGLTNITNALSVMGFPAREGVSRLMIEDMTCASCTGRVERTLMQTLGVKKAEVNLATNSASVTYLEGLTSPAELAQIISKAGYPATVQSAEVPLDHTERQEIEATLIAKRVVIAGILTLPVFVMEMGSHLIPALHMAIKNTIGLQISWMIQFVLTTLVMIWPGRGFYQKGLQSLRHLAPDMNSLVAVGTGAAYLYSVIATFFPSILPDGLRAVYFEAAAVIIVLILVGRWLEARAKGRTGTAIQSLMQLQPRTAMIQHEGDWVETPIASLSLGHMILIKPGERIPVDGIVRQGESHIDESMISGEPIPVLRTTGDTVTGGTVNGSSNFVFEATHVGADTTLSQIIRMVERAQSAKLPIQGLVDRITLWFVPAIMLLAILTVGAWLIFGPSPALSYALVAGVSVLIIACPCAMGLATPTSIMVGTGRAAQLGVLFRKGDALQQLGSIDVIAFDKTGTLTEGRPTVSEFITTKGFDRNTLLARIGSIESQSQHPIATAIVHAAKEQGLLFPTVDKIIHVTGYGIEAEIDEDTILIGADRLMVKNGIDLSDWSTTEAKLASEGQTVLYAAQNGQIAALIAVTDPIKSNSQMTIQTLKSMGLRVAMVTGDKQETATTIAKSLGIDNVIAGVLPEGKVDVINELKTYGKIAFVGDGINDAPALAQADVGIAIGTGTDIAIESADVVLMSGDLGGVVNALTMSRRTMRNIKQNLAWAFGYNVALIPVAAGVFYPIFGWLLSPVLGAAAMGLSSVFVLTNALRLRRIPSAVAQGDKP